MNTTAPGTTPTHGNTRTSAKSWTPPVQPTIEPMTPERFKEIQVQTKLNPELLWELFMTKRKDVKTRHPGYPPSSVTPEANSLVAGHLGIKVEETAQLYKYLKSKGHEES